VSGRGAGVGRGAGALRSVDGGLRRELVVLVVAVVVVAVLAGVSLTVGEIALSPGELLSAIVGRADRVTTFVLEQLRGPRLLAAVLVGASLGAAGGIVQSVVRNPIASPDVIGITAGASASGITAIALFSASGIALFGVVVGGGIVVALLVGFLAWRGGASGGLSGNRLVLVGIGIAALATSLTGWMLTRGDVQDTAVALLWLTGSINNVDDTVLGFLLVAFVVLFVLALVQSRRLDVLTLGDEVAASLGLAPNPAKVWLLLTAVGLTAAAVATAGPVSFVALMAAPIARRLVGRGRVSLAPAAAVGAAIVEASDLVAQFVIPGVQLPVGVVTGVVGAPYLLWLIARAR
jgi:iron complex transport system permease protein